MKFQWSIVCLLISLVNVSARDESNETQPLGLTVDAAFSYYPHDASDVFLYLFVGGRVILLKNNVLYMHHGRHNLDLPEDMQLGAATIMSDENQTILYYGSKFGFVINYAFVRKKRRIQYSERTVFKRNGPDAMATKGGKVYVFKDCQMVERINFQKWGQPKNVRSLGLPCYVDAAWKDRDGMILLKGDQIWRWAEDNSVDGPRPFHETYDLKWWKLRTSVDEEIHFDINPV